MSSTYIMVQGQHELDNVTWEDPDRFSFRLSPESEESIRTPRRRRGLWHDYSHRIHPTSSSHGKLTEVLPAYWWPVRELPYVRWWLEYRAPKETSILPEEAAQP